MTEPGRLRSRLAPYEDALPGHRVELVEASIVAHRVRPHHNATIRRVWNALRAQLSGEWGFTSDVAFVFDGETELCPDLAVIPEPEVAENRSAYDPDLIELVVEVVSPGSVRRDYEIKPRLYAARGIANYLVFDPYQAHCVTFWHPTADGYQGRDTIPYGKDIALDSGLGALTIDTSELPRDAAAPTG
ncbi:Uma2 family endonuclease [Streptomyces sp. NRRL F-5126]|uniref:Uma2 family endonuclease n=1 Tax=Streptomyces sp. NRRL F-5126 TaxID=1463857 RepID=UPI0004C6BB68|nr:Uma2 family endonuclease [Streptomyces sp. NRRL F-5126]